MSQTEPKSFHLGQASYKLTVMESKAQEIPDLSVRSIARGPGRIELSISFCSDRVPDAFAGHTLRILYSTVSPLTSINIVQPTIPSRLQYGEMQKSIPLPPGASLPTSATLSGSSEAVRSLTQEHTPAVQLIIAQA